MRFGKRYMPLGILAVAVSVAVGVIIGPAQGQASSAASFTASDYHWQVTGTTDTSVTIAPGQTVTFSYPTGASAHNADFVSGPAPGSCAQTAGASSGTTPPLPHQPTAAGWSGSCAFPAAGTYTFHCDFHPSMTGTIVVGNATTSSTSTSTSTSSSSTSTSPTSTSSTTSRATTTTATGAGPEAGGGVAAGQRPPPLAGALALAARQSGARVRGSVTVHIPGSRLEVDLVADNASAAKHSSRARLVGRLVRRSVPAGVVPFTVAVSPAARRQLRRHRSLRLTVTVSLTPPHARAAVRTSRVTLTA